MDGTSRSTSRGEALSSSPDPRLAFLYALCYIVYVPRRKYHTVWEGVPQHLFRHGCTRKQVDDVITERCKPTRVRDGQQPDHRALLGQACDGTFRQVIAEPKPERGLKPFACFTPQDDDALQRYLAWRTTTKGRR